MTDVDQAFEALPDHVKQSLAGGREVESSPALRVKKTTRVRHSVTSRDISRFVNDLLDKGESTDVKKLAKKVKDHFGLSRITKSLRRTIGGIKSRRTRRLGSAPVVATRATVKTKKTTRKRRKSARKKPTKKTARVTKAKTGKKKISRKGTPEGKQAVREVFAEHGLELPTDQVKVFVKEKGHDVTGNTIHGVRMDERGKANRKAAETES